MSKTYKASTPSQDTNSLSVLFENIDVLLKNKNAILANPSNYYIHIRGTGITGVYIGYSPLYLGDLLRLWSENSNWIKRPEQSTKYVYHLGGFPTSGLTFLKTYDVDKKSFQEEEHRHFAEYFKEAEAITKSRPTQSEDEQNLQRSKTIQELIKELN